MDGAARQASPGTAKKNLQLAEENRQLSLRIAALESARPTTQPSSSVKRNRQLEASIARLVDEYFDDEELANLAYDVGLDYDGLNGEGKAARARAFVAHFGKRGLLDVLLKELGEERPNVEWFKFGD